MTTEIWKICPRFPNYEVSDAGNVRRWKMVRGKPGAIVRPWMGQGYRRYHLRADGRYHHPFAHQLVAEAFIGPKPFDGAEVCHNDGDKLNVHPTNLRWDTHAANGRDSSIHGSMPRGSETWKAKLTEADVLQIRKLVAEGARQRDVADMFGIRHASVSPIISRITWKHI